MTKTAFRVFFSTFGQNELCGAATAVPALLWKRVPRPRRPCGEQADIMMEQMGAPFKGTLTFDVQQGPDTFPLLPGMFMFVP